MVRCAFVQLTDHHLRESEAALGDGYSTAYALRMVLQHIALHVAERVDFMVATGDIVETPSAATYQHVCQLFQTRRAATMPLGHQLSSFGQVRDLPTYFLPGNLDDRDLFFRYLAPDPSGATRMNTIFQHGGLRFICFDWGPQAKAIADQESFAFLRQALATQTPCIILMHQHVVPLGMRWMDDFIADNVSEFAAIIAGQPILGIFHGHTHTTYESSLAGIPIFGLRSTAPQFVHQDSYLQCLQPPHYRFVLIEDRLLTTRVFEVPL